MKSLIALLILVYCANTIATQTYELPDLGEHSATILSPKEEKEMGKEFMKEVYRQYSVLNDIIINEYIQNLGNKLAANSNAKNKKFNFFIVKDPSINAFAGPDANIGINSGTFIATRSESELAAVLAHEIAHVTQHHIERLIERAKKAQLAATAGALAALIVGITAGSSGNIATGTAMASMGGMAQHMIAFTQDKEIEADNIGIRTLYNSGFDPSAVPGFFERVQRSTYNYSNTTPTSLLTHPTTNTRIAEAKNRANQYPKKQINTNNTHALMSARIQALTFRNSSSAVKYFQKQQVKNNSAATQYGYAIALYKNVQLKKAMDVIDNLYNKFPNEILFQIAAAQIATANKQTDKAINILKSALYKHPNYQSLVLQYGQTLIAGKRTRIARDFLKSKIIEHADNADLYLLLAKAYAQNNQKTDAYQAQAKAYELYGYNQKAKVLLQQALKDPKLKPIERSIIHARIDRLQNK